MSSPVIESIRPVYVAALNFEDGCGGDTAAGHALFDVPLSRSAIEDIWTSVRKAIQAAEAQIEKQIPASPYSITFDEAWKGTLGDFRRARAALTAAGPAREAERSKAMSDAESDAWAAAGGRHVWLSSSPENWGSAYGADEPTDGLALFVSHYRGCRCMCGSGGYGEDAGEDDVTPRSWLVTITANDETFEAVCPTGDESALLAAINTAQRATSIIAAQRRIHEAQRAVYVATTVEEIEAMTFSELAEWRVRAGVPKSYSRVGEIGHGPDPRSEESWATAATKKFDELLGLGGIHRTNGAPPRGRSW